MPEHAMRLSTRLTIAMVALVLVTAAAIGLLTYRNVVAIALPRGLDRIDTHARVIATVLEASVLGARADVIGFRASNSVADIMAAHLNGFSDPAATTVEAEWRKRLARRFVAELTGKLDYVQFRVIGIADGGREIVRVDRSGPDGAIRVVPDAELQRKGDRDYFKRTIALPADGIYVSPIDLNQEQGVIETPNVPTLRTAAPIYTPDGQPFGIVIINVDMRRAFAAIRSNTRGGTQLYLVNEDGDYLLHPDPSREFGFELGKPARLQDDFPEFTGLLANEDTAPRVMTDRAGARFGVGWESVRLAGGPRVGVIETVPFAQVIAAATAIRNSSLFGGLAAVVCALILAVAFARSLTRPLVQMTKAVEAVSDDASITMPSGGGREIGVLAGAFNKMVAESHAKTAALKREIEERRRIFDTSPDLILVTDRQGNFTRVSPSCEAILGYRPEEMTGHSAVEFIYPDDLEPTRSEMRLARHGKITRNFETRYVHKDGHVVMLSWTGVWSEAARQHFFVARDMTEQKLAEEKFRLAVEASPSGLVMIDGGGLIVLINAETERLFGYERHELIGQPIDILVPTHLRAPHVQHRSEFVARPEARRMGAGRDLYGLRKDGTEFPVEIGLNPIQTQGGLLVLSVIVDISERKRAEAAIRDYAEREQLFIAAVESSNDAIVTKTLDGVITGWNQAAERLFGFTAQEAIGERIDLIVPNELRDEVRGILAKIKNGEKVDHHETVRVNKNGRRVDVSLSVSPVKSQSGAIIGAAKVARDIGARKKAQEALLESEQMARAIIDTALDAFVQLDHSGVIIGWSPKAEEMFGWPRQEAVGQKLSDLVIPAENRGAYSQRISQFFQEADSGILGRRYEAPSLRRDGTRFSTEVSLTALRRRDGYIINGFIRDITEKVAAEEQFRQAQKMESVGQLTGGIAHDFNNMLTVITGTIDILGEAVADKPQLAAIAKLISEAADRGAELTGHLLAFARKQPLQPRDTDINALLVEAGKLLRPTLGEHIEIESVLKNDVWLALVDPGQLSSALLNLAINARDAMPNGGKLILETNNVVLDQGYAKANADVQPGDYVLIAVSDTGGGIPEAIRDKVFEPFFTTKEVGRGTGLGLSMVYGFIKQSGGHIKVYSEVGHGTTFKLYLPRADAQAEPLAAISSDAEIEGGNETILIVEDDALVRTSVIAQIQSLGYQTLSAANAAEALAIADRGAQFDLLFADVIMPGKMNGRQLAEEMAKRRAPLRVLFTSGYTENAIIHHGRLDPGVLLLVKPYRKAELSRMLRRALEGAENPPIRSEKAPKAQAI
jgi:PAS domain S-box-containing protein